MRARLIIGWIGVMARLYLLGDRRGFGWRYSWLGYTVNCALNRTKPYGERDGCPSCGSQDECRVVWKRVGRSREIMIDPGNKKYIVIECDACESDFFGYQPTFFPSRHRRLDALRMMRKRILINMSDKDGDNTPLPPLSSE